MTILQFVKGPNAKIHLTMMISGSKYPKNIYDMSLFGFGVEKEFKFEFKFKFELKQKRKTKRKEKNRKRKKEKRAQAIWAGFGRTTHCSSPRPTGGRAHS